VDETHQSHDCVLGTAYLLDYLIDLMSFGSTLLVVFEENQRNIPLELRFDVFAAVKFYIVVVRVITPCSLALDKSRVKTRLEFAYLSNTTIWWYRYV